MGYTLARLDGAPYLWLLTFSLAGRTYRLSTGSVHITDDDGDDLPFVGEISDPSLALEADLYALDPAAASVPIEAVLPDADIAALHAGRFDLTGALAELSIHFPGDTWEERIPQIVGRIVDLSYGAADEPIRFTLESRPSTDDPPILAAQARIASDTWTDPGARGAYYPLVFGAPGADWTDPDGTTHNTSGSPAWVADTVGDLILIGLGPVDAAGEDVKVYNDSDGSSETFAVEAARDDLGRPVAVVDVSTPGGLTVGNSDRYFVRWDDGGGLTGEDGTSLGRLGDLLWYLLSQWGGRWDRGRVAAILDWLNRINVAGYIDDPEITLWGWLQSHLLPLVPIGAAMGPEGLYFVPYFLDAQPESAVAHLREGEQIYAIDGTPGQIREGARDAIMNSPRLSYALRARTGDYQGEAAIVGTDPVGLELDSAYSRHSVARFGVRPEVLSSDIIYEGASAIQVLAWRVRAFAEPPRTVTYALDPRSCWLERGAYVLVTHAAYSLDAQPALILRTSWRGGFPFIELRLWPGLV